MRLALLLLSLGAVPTRAAPTVPGCEVPRDACAFFTGYLAAFNRRDWEAFRATLDDSVTVMFDRPAPPERRDGRTEVEALFRLVFPPPGTPAAALPPPIEPDGLRAQDFGDVVVISFHLRGDAEVARRTVVLHLGTLGWRVVHIHGSSRDRPAGR